MRHPINKCVVCGKPIIRMIRVATWDGFYLSWPRRKYCNDTCRQRAQRRRNKLRRIHQWHEKGI